jgi:hypothetical protein
MANRITTLFDLDAKGFDSGLKKLRTEVAKADGAVNKLKAAGSGLGTILQDNLANAAVAAGAALLAFGVKSVKAFQDTALAAGQFSDATGLAVDEASRLIEVAGDLNIEAGTVESALGKMNKTLGASPQLFTDLGVEIAKTDTGATDVNGTFLNVVDRLNAIEDPAERARVASQLLGKGWQGMAELIGQGSTALKASLAGVGDAQVIDEKELKKAREFRDRMDQLKDRLSAVALELGESLVPALTQMAENAVPAAQAVAKVADAWMTVGNAVKNTAEVSAEMYLQNGLTVDQLEEMGYSADEVSDALVKLGLSTVETTDVTAEMARMYGQRLNPTVEDSTQAFDAAAEEANDLAIKTGRVERAAQALSDEWDRLKGKIDDKAAWFNMQATFDDIRDKGAAAMQAVADGTEDAEQKMHEYRDAVIGGQQEVFDLGKQLGLLPDEVSVLIELAENGQIDELERRLTILTRNRTANLDIIARGGAGYGNRYVPGGSNVVGATGGIVTRPTMALIGEAGPEAVVPLNRTPGSSPLPGGVGSPMVVNIYPKSLPTDRELIDLVTNLRRRNGGVI